MNYLIAFFSLFSITSSTLFSQKDYEIGVEITAASGSNLGGSVGGSLKFAIVEDEALAYGSTYYDKVLAYGPSIRYQYLWSNNNFTGINANASLFGGGGFLHYRFMEWFFIGTEIEVLTNPFPVINPDKKWTLTAFFGGGVHRDFDWVKLNVGLLFDAADALRDPLKSNPSPLRTSYFIQLKKPNPGSEPNGAYLPIIYRIAFFFPIG